MKMRFLSLLAAATLALAACDNGSSPQQSVVSGGAPQASPVPSASSIPSTVWPFTASDAKIVLAPNLLTKNYMVVFDESGSMEEAACNDRGKSKDEVARAAVGEFTSIVPSDANLGLVIFDNETSVRVVLGSGPENRSKFKTAIAGARPGGGGTPLHSSMRLGYQELLRQAQAQLGYGEYHLVVVTDGAATGYNQDPKPLVKELSSTPVIVHTIGFCIGANHSLNQAGVTYYQEAGDQESLRKGLKDVLAEAPAFDAIFRK